MTQTAQSAPNPLHLRDAQLNVWTSGDRFKANFTFYGPDGQESSDPEIDLGFDRSMLKQRLDSIESALTVAAQNGLWSELANPLGPPLTDGARRKFEALLEAVASEGASLYRQFAKIPLFNDFLRKVDALRDGSRITVHTEGAILPWEILYPLPFNKESLTKQPVDRLRFWGCRFEIEQMVLRKGKSTDWKVKDHQNAKAFVNLNVNPRIGDELSKGPFPSRYRPVEEHKSFYDDKLGKEKGVLMLTGDQIKRAVLSESRATVIYLYCHGQSADGKNKEALEVADKVFIDPDTVAFEEYKYTCGPLLILNSCSSGAYSPLSLTNFYSEFKDKRAIGVIGTMTAMPATFAAAFGLRLIDDYVNYKGEQGATIGGVLRSLRREIINSGNPLGLLYVLQCPLHATARRA